MFTESLSPGASDTLCLWLGDVRLVVLRLFALLLLSHGVEELLVLRLFALLPSAGYVKEAEMEEPPSDGSTLEVGGSRLAGFGLFMFCRHYDDFDEPASLLWRLEPMWVWWIVDS